MKDEQDNPKRHVFTSEQKLDWWGYGEWVEEIDYDEWEYKGIKCKIVRISMRDGPHGEHIFGGSINGYVCLPKDHPWTELKDLYSINVDVHGGITYNGKNEDGETWIGFDTAHLYDIIPSIEKHRAEAIKHTNPSPEFIELFVTFAAFQQVYRNVEYVKKECEKLVDQMLEAKITS